MDIFYVRWGGTSGGTSDDKQRDKILDSIHPLELTFRKDRTLLPLPLFDVDVIRL